MADIGTTLREARIRARIDISEVETRTKIRAKYLRAIENEEWDLLPGPVYVKSFLRTYGDFLGVDSRRLVDEYKRRYERPADQDVRPISSLGRERERRAPPPPLGACGRGRARAGGRRGRAVRRRQPEQQQQQRGFDRAAADYQQRARHDVDVDTHLDDAPPPPAAASTQADHGDAQARADELGVRLSSRTATARS